MGKLEFVNGDPTVVELTAQPAGEMPRSDEQLIPRSVSISMHDVTGVADAVPASAISFLAVEGFSPVSVPSWRHAALVKTLTVLPAWLSHGDDLFAGLSLVDTEKIKGTVVSETVAEVKLAGIGGCHGSR